MQERLNITGQIRQVDLTTGDEAGRDWMSYKIRIETDQGAWEISGCHDVTPEVTQVSQKPDGEQLRLLASYKDTIDWLCQHARHETGLVDAGLLGLTGELFCVSTDKVQLDVRAALKQKG